MFTIETFMELLVLIAEKNLALYNVKKKDTANRFCFCFKVFYSMESCASKGIIVFNNEILAIYKYYYNYWKLKSY